MYFASFSKNLLFHSLDVFISSFCRCSVRVVLVWITGVGGYSVYYRVYVGNVLFWCPDDIAKFLMGVEFGFLYWSVALCCLSSESDAVCRVFDVRWIIFFWSRFHFAWVCLGCKSRSCYLIGSEIVSMKCLGEFCISSGVLFRSVSVYNLCASVFYYSGKLAWIELDHHEGVVCIFGFPEYRDIVEF